jgi:putative phosphoribosyl transferase
MVTRFDDRRHAGRLLGAAVNAYRADQPLVLGLPRGGVVVAAEVAAALGAPLDLWIARKLGVPFRPELGMGAIAEGPALVLDRALVRDLGISPRQVLAVARREGAELRRRAARYRGDRPLPDVEGRTVILVDDGIATGGTVRAAVRGLRKRGARRIVVATPIASPEAADRLRGDGVMVVCLAIPHDLRAIGRWYRDFGQTSDEEVIELLAAHDLHDGNPIRNGRTGT